jgi:hypothetical protein
MWVEAKFLVLSQLQAGVHAQVLEGHIRELLRNPLRSYYRHSYLLYALRALRNLCSNNVFEKLPVAKQYHKLKENPFLLAIFEMEMYNHFRNRRLLELKATDCAIESRLSKSLRQKRSQRSWSLHFSSLYPAGRKSQRSFQITRGSYTTKNRWSIQW